MRNTWLGISAVVVGGFVYSPSAKAADTMLLAGVGSLNAAHGDNTPVINLKGDLATAADTIQVAHGGGHGGFGHGGFGHGMAHVGGFNRGGFGHVGGFHHANFGGLRGFNHPWYGGGFGRWGWGWRGGWGGWGGWYRPWGLGWHRPWGWYRPWGLGLYRPWRGWYGGGVYIGAGYPYGGYQYGGYQYGYPYGGNCDCAQGYYGAAYSPPAATGYASSTTQLPAPQQAIEQAPPPRPTDGYRYDGGPRAPLPAAPAPVTPPVPVKPAVIDTVARRPATKKLEYPAYGEEAGQGKPSRSKLLVKNVP